MTRPAAKGYVVPMFESERGWGSKIDGYAGPFPTYEDALGYQRWYNNTYNTETTVPDYYIAAQEPVEFINQACEYRTDLYEKSLEPPAPPAPSITPNAQAFIDANAKSAVVSGYVIEPNPNKPSRGACYRLENGKTFRLSAEECGMVKPRWGFEEGE